MSRTPETPLWHACWHLTRPAATGRYAPLKDGGALLSGGEDLDQKGLIECASSPCTGVGSGCRSGCWAAAHTGGRRRTHVLRYCWDMLYVTMFVQLSTGFLSDLFWLLCAPPSCHAIAAVCLPRHIAPQPPPPLSPSPSQASLRPPAPRPDVMPGRGGADTIPPSIGMYFLWVKVIYP